MKTKPYPQIEEKPLVLEEPAVAYGSATQSCASLYQPTPYEMEVLRRSEEDSKAGRVYTQEEVDKLLEPDVRVFHCDYFLIYYKIKEEYIEVEAVFDTRQDPEKLPY